MINLDMLPSRYMAADDGAANTNVGGSNPPAANENPAPESAPPEGQQNDNPFGFDLQQNSEQNQESVNQQDAVPESYEFKLAEGLVLDEKVKTEFTAIAKELKLNQSQVDKLIDMHGRVVLSMVNAANAQTESWMQETMKQGLAGPVGQKNAKLCLDTFGGGEAVRALVDSGVIFNPAVFKMLSTIGGLLQEDNTKEGSTSVNKSIGDIFFPNSQ